MNKYITAWWKIDASYGLDTDFGKYFSAGLCLVPSIDIYFYKDKTQKCFYISFRFLFFEFHVNFEK